MTVRNLKSQIAISLVFFINFIFLVKYTSRITSYSILLSLIITGFYSLVWVNRFRLSKLFQTRYIAIAGTILFLTVSLFLFKKIPYEQLNVDRWSVIASFWENYFRGEYVYYAKSNFGNPPGPMPFYFILALPFYLIGELGYFSLLGIIVFALLLRYKSIPTYLQTTSVLLILGSSFYLWEVICRSNIFLNASLIVWSIVYLSESFENKRPNAVLTNGIIIGLLLSTRNVFIIPYIVCGLFLIKSKLLSFKNAAYMSGISILVFALTFVPFVYNHTADFLIMNPFIVQSGFLMPLSYSMICIGISFVTVFIVKDKSDVFFYTGLQLFLIIVLHYIYESGQFGFDAAFFGSRADISYFILSVPFLLFYAVKDSAAAKK